MVRTKYLFMLEFGGVEDESKSSDDFLPKLLFLYENVPPSGAQAWVHRWGTKKSKAVFHIEEYHTQKPAAPWTVIGPREIRFNSSIHLHKELLHVSRVSYQNV